MKIEEYLKKIYRPAADSHKGENGKVLIIAGSKLFHAASIWPAEIASKIVDMVFYSSVDENNLVVKGKFANGIVIPREKLDDYINEIDSILIGPGLPRPDGKLAGDQDTEELTEGLFAKFPNKKWVVDGGSLQTIDPKTLPKTAIVTPHHGEFKTLFGVEGNEESTREMAKKFGLTILLKGPTDIVCGPFEASTELSRMSSAQGEIRCERISGGNPGMTKGGTGDVLAGLVTAFYAKNDAFTSAVVGSFINKKAGESLFTRQGLYFNATDLVNEIPAILKTVLTN